MDYELIESYQEVVENVRQFNQDLVAKSNRDEYPTTKIHLPVPLR
jgi:hypothetical protein